MTGTEDWSAIPWECADEAAKYAAASAIALVADTGLMLGLTRYGGWHYLRPAVSFTAGAVIAYLLSVRFVFHAHRLRSRGLEFGGFVAIGVVGVAVNMLVLFVTHGKLGMDLLLAKALRRGALFSRISRCADSCCFAPEHCRHEPHRRHRRRRACRSHRGL